MELIGRYHAWMGRSPTWRAWEGNYTPAATIVALALTGSGVLRGIRWAEAQFGEFGAFAAQLCFGVIGLLVIWPTIAVTVVMGGRLIAGMVDRPPSRRLDSQATALKRALPVNSTGIAHLRGWLLVFALWSMFLALGRFHSCYSLLPVTGAREMSPLFYLAFQAQAISFGWAVAFLIGLARLRHRERSTRSYWLVVLVLFIPVTFIEFSFGLALASRAAELRGIQPRQSSSATGIFFLQAVIALGWLVYWARSGRIRRTFTESDLDGPNNSESRGAS